jgi:hypothetical protein
MVADFARMMSSATDRPLAPDALDDAAALLVEPCVGREDVVFEERPQTPLSRCVCPETVDPNR